jgi:hypothetical protein
MNNIEHVHRFKSNIIAIAKSWGTHYPLILYLCSMHAFFSESKQNDDVVRNSFTQAYWQVLCMFALLYNIADEVLDCPHTFVFKRSDFFMFLYEIFDDSSISVSFCAAQLRFCVFINL